MGPKRKENNSTRASSVSSADSSSSGSEDAAPAVRYSPRKSRTKSPEKTKKQSLTRASSKKRSSSQASNKNAEPASKKGRRKVSRFQLILIKLLSLWMQILFMMFIFSQSSVMPPRRRSAKAQGFYSSPRKRAM